MWINKLFFIDCSKAADCCDKAQYEEAGTLDKLKMMLHLKFCEKCREYTEKNTKLTRLIHKAGIKPCSEEEKKAWKQQIESNLPNQRTEHQPYS